MKTVWFTLLLAMSSAACGQSAPAAALTNTIGMRFVLLPAGEFMMGSDDAPEALERAYPAYERRRFVVLGDEGPSHRVRITRAFYMGQHEVTVGQFRRFLERSGYVPESEADGTGAYGYDPRHQGRDAFAGRDLKYSWRDPGFAQDDDHPVVNVSWHDAQALADWLSRQEGVRYRLPTEAEWEYACRAGSAARYHGGDDPVILPTLGNVFDRAAATYWPQWSAYALADADGHAFTAPVGRFAPNAFDLYDMHGNVWEWASDWHEDDYYARSPRDDPQGPERGKVRVRRGGSWHTWSLYARCAYRNWNTPDTRYPLVGIRLVRELPMIR